MGLMVLLGVASSRSATLTVTNSADSGPGTLRQAILDANADSSPNDLTISFNIPAVGVQTIAPLSGLPTITRRVTIDGYTQPGASSNTLANADNAALLIQLTGTNVVGGSGLSLASGSEGSLVRGLIINGFSGGISIGSSSNVIAGNFIGTDLTGTNALANETGVSISGALGNRIGGLTSDSRNIISGNSYGISLSGTGTEILGNYIGLGADGLTIVANHDGITLNYGSQNQIGGSSPGARNVISGNTSGFYANQGGSNVIQGNFIGTDASGTLPRPNLYGVVLNESSHNLIGGTQAGEGNLISGNSSQGVTIEGVNGSSNVVAGNLIGADIAGTNALGNGNYGVVIIGGAGNLIGGTSPGAANVIGGNAYQGVAIFYAQATGNVVQGNFIGTDPTGSLVMSNRASGVLIYGAPGNQIGGTTAGARNVIAFSTYAGVAITVDGATNNSALGNRIFAIGGPGIDLALDGVTANDSGDGDEGANHLQNSPEISSAALLAGDLTVRYRVDSAAANSAYPLTVEFFLADSGGSGKTLICRHTYDTPQILTNITFTPATAVNDGAPIVATATDANGNTSEFSSATPALANHRPIVANPIPDQGGTYGNAFSYAFPANTFSDPDAGDALSYTATGLPPGVLFDGPTRTLSGSPTAAGTFTVTVTATDDGTPMLSTNDMFDIVVAKGSLIATADNKRRIQGQPNPSLTGTLVGVRNNDNITATFATPAATDSPPGDYPITPVLSDPDNRLPNYTATTNAGTLTVVDCTIFAISNASLPTPVKGTAYSITLKAINGAAPYIFSLAGGSLPANLTLAADGVLAGTPASLGNFPVTIAAASADGCTVSSNYVLTVVCPQINLTPASLPAAIRDTGYSQQIDASGGTASYSFAVATGAIPDGLTLSSAGLLSGTPTTTGDSVFTVTATDADACTGNRGYTLTVGCPLVLSPATLPNAFKSVPYNRSFSASGGTAPYTFTRTSGTLPAGLSLSSGGLLAGIPTTVGNSSFTIKATDSSGCLVSSNYVLAVNTLVYEGFAYPQPGPLAGGNGGIGFSTAWGGTSGFFIIQGSLFNNGGPTSGNNIGIGGNGTISRRLSQSIGTAGTVRYLTFFSQVIYPSFLGPPSPTERVGLMLNGTTGPGLFIGKPNTGGQFNWVLENAGGGAQVVGPPLFQFVPSVQTLVVVKCEFFAGNDRFTLYVNPTRGQPEPASGTVKFNSDVGTITNIAFTVSALQNGSWQFDEVLLATTWADAVPPACPTITVSPASLPAGSLGVAYSQTLSASGGSEPYSFSVASGALPNGLTVSTGGVLSGTPTNGGNFSFTVAATDANGCTGIGNYAVTIPCPAIAISPGNVAQATVGLAYSQNLSATGGNAPYSFAVTGGALPPGLTLSSSGSLSGTPTSTGTYLFTVTATDAANCSGSANYFISTYNFWLGDGVANQWNFDAANWARGLFHDGDDVVFDDNGSNNVPVDITTVVSPGSLLVSATKDYIFAGSGQIAGTNMLTKINSGNLKLSTSNSYTGVTLITGGRLTVQHNSALGATSGGTTVTNSGSLQIDGNGLNIAEPLILSVPFVNDGLCDKTNAALNNLGNSNTWSGPITLGTTFGSGPLIKSEAGLLTLNSTTPITGPGYLEVAGTGDVFIGSGIASDVGAVLKYGSGTLTLTGTNASSASMASYCDGKIAATPIALGSGDLSCGSGTIEINAGGAASIANPLVINGGKLRASGGTVAYSRLGYPQMAGYGRLETAARSDQLIFNSAISIFTHGGGIYVTGPGTVVLNSGSTSALTSYDGYWYLFDGVLQLNNVNGLGNPGGASQRPIYLYGGALRTGVNSGGTFSINTLINDKAAIQPGRSTLGAGVSNYFGDLYFFTNQVTVSPGSNLTSGSTADLGFGFTSARDTAIFDVENVGGVNARVTLTAAVSDNNSPPLTLTKNGNGTLVLLAANTFNGDTTVSNGTLKVSNTTGSGTGNGNVTVFEGATLAGNGRISRSVFIQSGGTLAPGNSIGTLAISNSLIFAAGSTNLMEVNLNTRTNDVVVGLTNVTYGGTLVVSNIGAQILTNGAAFKLFNATHYNGSFASIQPPTPGPGLLWDPSSLTVNGKLKVVGCPVLTVTPATLPGGQLGASYTASLSTGGGVSPYSFAVSAGTLPGGLSLSSDGLLSGTLNSAGSFSFTITSTDAGRCTGSRSYTLTVCGPIAISPSALPGATVTGSYQQTLTATGGGAPYSFGVTAGALPDGLTLSGTGGLSGTPTAAGTFSFTITATDVGNCAGFTAYSLIVNNKPSITISMSGGSPSFCWPTNNSNAVLESTDSLTPPINWQPATNTISMDGANNCVNLAPEPTVAGRFYRLRIP